MCVYTYENWEQESKQQANTHSKDIAEIWLKRYQGDDTNASNIYYLANQPKKLNAWAKVAKNAQYEFDNILLLSVMT